MEYVELGFIKKTTPWKLHSKFFPSKVGGKPAWLTLNELPQPSDLLCKNCRNPYIFLLQVYANIDESSDTFHRSIFVFMCSNGNCIKRFSNENFIVFRTQLPRKNEFYSFEPATMDKKSSSSEEYLKLCDVCGCKAITMCNKCSKMYYCSDYHRTCDWNSTHQRNCGTEAGIKKKVIQPNPFLLPEYEIESDAEDMPPEKPEKSEAEKMQEYQHFMSSNQAPQELQDVPLDDLDVVMKKKDKVFNKFRKRVDHAPDQVGSGSYVILKISEGREFEYAFCSIWAMDFKISGRGAIIAKTKWHVDKKYSIEGKADIKYSYFAIGNETILRYQRGGNPLLVSSEHVPTEAEIPPCSCGTKRIFEFQIMPQLLRHLSLDSVGESPDWGTLLVYTCSKSCKAGTGAYVQEFLWKQDYSDTQ